MPQAGRNWRLPDDSDSCYTHVLRRREWMNTEPPKKVAFPGNAVARDGVVKTEAEGRPLNVPRVPRRLSAANAPQLNEHDQVHPAVVRKVEQRITAVPLNFKPQRKGLEGQHFLPLPDKRRHSRAAFIWFSAVVLAAHDIVVRVLQLYCHPAIRHRIPLHGKGHFRIGGHDRPDQRPVDAWRIRELGDQRQLHRGRLSDEPSGGRGDRQAAESAHALLRAAHRLVVALQQTRLDRGFRPLLEDAW